MSYCIDTNVFITAWHRDYPKHIFPKLYHELKSKLSDQIIIIKPIFDEIEPVTGGDTKLNLLDKETPNEHKKKEQRALLENHPVRIWLKRELKIEKTPITKEVQILALKLEGKYEVDENSKGASPADIKLIAFAALKNHIVVTFETYQINVPTKKSNYKIPLICEKEGVKCITFIEMLDRINIRCD